MKRELKVNDKTTTPFMDMANNLLKDIDEKKENYKKHYVTLLENPIELKKFYTEKTLLDTWLLNSEAIPFLLGVEPSQWINIKGMHLKFIRELAPLIKASAGMTLKVINPDAKEKDWRVKPKEFVKWLHSKGIRPRQELEEVLKLKFTKNVVKEESSYSDHPNAEHHAQKRQKVLEAALAILANYPEQCMDKGKVSGTVIARIMEEKSPLWFKNDDIPLSARKVRDLINQALKLPDA